MRLVRRHEIAGVALAWDRWGPDQGTPFVLVHGYSGSSHDFALQIPTLAEERPVVAVDHRGHGDSSKLGRENAYSVAQITKDFTAFLSTVADEPVDLLGHSMGGRIALSVALDRPDLVRSLILMDTTAWAFVDPDDPMSQVIGAFIEAMDPSEGLPDISGFARPEQALIEAATPEDWRAAKELRDQGFDPFAMKALGQEIFSPDLASHRDRLGELACTVTVIVGENDEPYVSQAPALAGEIPGAELTVIPGAYHSPQLTHPVEWRDAVAAHLDRTSRRAD